MSSNSTTDPNHRSSGDGSNMLIAIAAVSIFLIIFTVVVIRLYTRWLYRRRRRETDALTLVQQLALQAVAVHMQALNVDQPKSGVDPSAIATFPTYAYRCGAGGLAADCAVCLAAMEGEEMVRSLPNCMHIFHAECIDRWLHSHSTCPVCRVDAGPPASRVEDSGVDDAAVTSLTAS